VDAADAGAADGVAAADPASPARSGATSDSNSSCVAVQFLTACKNHSDVKPRREASLCALMPSAACALPICSTFRHECPPLAACRYLSAEGGLASGVDGDNALVFEDDVVLPTISPASRGGGNDTTI